eukprot:gene17978-12886_t
MPNEVKYWRHPNADDAHGKEDLVVIHVCDENQQVSKDFCCRRDILVQHMRYFQKFLNETENGYDDIDISVHCDVEIFEWLMNYIHDTSNPPKMDKAILISILISSEFLQMDPLVELCVSQVSQSLNDIIKLPIDLSCISEKLVNRIASITSPKALSEIKDRKDKILTKLYKRRVELDFSRKGSASKSSGGGGSSSSAPRTIAASLTCCRFCGWVYLENYSSFLTCRKSPPSIDHRGRLASRHSAIQGWSLTSYLKTLHSGGMGWDAIYWHVWAACIVLRVQDVVISALETDRYGVEPDGLLIKCMVANAGGGVGGGGDSDVGGSGAMNAWSSYKSTVRGTVGSSSTTTATTNAKTLEYALDMDMDSILSGTTTASGGTVSLAAAIGGSGGGADEAALIPSLKMTVFSQTITSYPTSIAGITPTLNPHRPPEILTPEIYELVCGQMKYITGIQHKTLIATTMQNMVTNAAKQDASSSASSSSSSSTLTMTGSGKATGVSEAFQELQALDDDDSRLYYGATGPGAGGGTGDTGADEKRRGRSPARAFARLYSVSQEPRKGGNGGGGGRRSSTVGPAIPSQSSSAGATATATAAAGGGVAAVGAASGNSSDNDATDTPYDSDADTPGGGNGGSGAGNGGSSGGNGAAGTGRAKGTTRVHSHELQRQQQQQPSSSRPRSLSSAGKRSTSTNASSLTSASAKTGGGGGGSGPGLPPKGRGKLLANGTGGHGAANAAHGGLVMGDVDDALTSDNNPEQEHELALQRLHRILASMPPDLQHRAQHQQKGALYGVWLQPCALTWQPPALEEMLCVVDESHLPDHKKLE